MRPKRALTITEGLGLRRLLKSLLLGASLVSQPLLADVSQLKALVDAQRFEEAYQYSLSVMPEYEGDPAFDLQYAIAAIDSGHVDEGMFALERVLLVQPKNQQARLEKARGLFLLGRFAGAQTLFNAVKETRPPAAVIARIDSFLALIASHNAFPATRFSHSVALFAGFDDNINSAPEAQTNIVTLSREALGRSDQFQLFQLNSRVDHQYRPDKALFFNFAAELRNYDTESEQNYRNLNFSGGHRWAAGADQYQFSVNMQKFSLDDQGYRDLLGLNAQWSHQYSQQLQVQSFIGLSQISYDTLSYKDSSLGSAGVGMLYAQNGPMQPLWFLTVFGGRERPDQGGILGDAEANKVFYGVNTGVRLQASNNLALTGSLLLQSTDYRGRDWIYGVKRQDEYGLLSLDLEWVLAPQWQWLTRYSYTHSDSNIELYDYDRHQILFGVRRMFN